MRKLHTLKRINKRVKSVIGLVDSYTFYKISVAGPSLPDVRKWTDQLYPFHNFNTIDGSLISLVYNSFVRALTVFADLYSFLTVWCSSALTVHTELCSLVLTVNCCKTEKLLTVVQLCSSFWGTAKFTVKYSLTRVTILDS